MQSLEKFEPLSSAAKQQPTTTLSDTVQVTIVTHRDQQKATGGVPSHCNATATQTPTPTASTSHTGAQTLLPRPKPENASLHHNTRQGPKSRHPPAATSNLPPTISPNTHEAPVDAGNPSRKRNIEDVDMGGVADKAIVDEMAFCRNQVRLLKDQINQLRHQTERLGHRIDQLRTHAKQDGTQITILKEELAVFKPYVPTVHKPAAFTTSLRDLVRNYLQKRRARIELEAS